MKFLLISVGTRGDMEPLLSMGEVLKNNGHEVICLMPEQYQYLVDESGFPFESLGPEFLELIEGELGQALMGGELSILQKIKMYKDIFKVQKPIQNKLMRIQQEVVGRINPDRIISNGKALYAVFWEKDNPGKTFINIPVPFLHYVKGHSHVAFHGNYGYLINKLTYWLGDLGIRKTAWVHRNRLAYKHISKKDVVRIIKNRKYLYTISPQLFKRPDYWASNFKVLGYHERNKQREWTPPKGLLDFIGGHPKCILITFGSMINANPLRKMEIIYSVLKKHNIPAVVNTAGGGLPELSDYDSDLVFYVKRIPYDWIFPKMYAVVHHGGSGTTHTAIKNGCASLIIPHIIDQFAWNTIVNDMGVGPLGPGVSKLNMHNFEKALIQLWRKKAYKSNAKRLGAKMKEEDFTNTLYKTLTADA